MTAASAQPNRVLQGRPAAPGFAAGRIVRLEREPGSGAAAARAVGTPDEEAAALKAALAAASADLAGLIGSLDDAEAAAMLEFQLAMLEDDALTEPAFAALAEGLGAEAAFAAQLDAEIAGYRASDDDYFRARGSDLEDLKARVLAHLAGAAGASAALADDAILVGRDLAPSRFLEIDWRPGQGIALAEGSLTSHVAILARARGIPMLVGVAGIDAPDGTEALLDAEAGTLLVAPDAADRAAFDIRRSAGRDRDRAAGAQAFEPAATACGIPVQVLLNIGGPGDLAGLDPALCDGIGLVRTEFLFHGRGGDDLPGEDEQFEAYRAILAWADGRPVTIRTLDAGGDKPIPGYTLDGEANPFLGLRGVRLSLAREAVFRIQLRALLRAAAHGPLKIMIPMVAVPAEMAAVQALVDREAAALAAAGTPPGRFELGMMVEVPAAALTLDLFAADFVSIGSNDLIQYLMAAGRDSAAVAALADPLAPAVLRVIETVAREAAARRLPVSLCGDAGGDPAAIPHLLAAGLRALSMGAAAVPRAKAAIRATHLTGIRP
ncbi:phosphoenolpyruvate--protein phosphotransferase [Prosthecomicrobium hirschii]|uniref:phosphoenolpyruvate--protein phosphotransferase n=1 Tax=Prosthecodimorpha hirschii TaxID=665126 RepID=UPI00112D4B83|nr:phosphoenolpyruvate--protein phosphotransferase [Prosthecomicrobium hirschii]TPQ49140.1 phosphoenolpyruvate--protein phosphotransferase [Prosthecomicrobium hirschii]